MKSHPEVMGERKKVVEHTFGTLKRAFGAPYLLLKGLKKSVARLVYFCSLII